MNPNPPVYEDQPTLPQGQPGSTLVVSYGFSGWAYTPADADVDTMQFDFYSPNLIDGRVFKVVMQQLANFIAGRGSELLAYGLWRSSVFGVTMPEQMCMLNYCWAPPFAGQTATFIYHYRLWVCARPIVAGGLSYRAIWPVLPILALALAIIMVGVFVVAAYEVLSGNLKFSQLIDAIRKLLKVPGESVSQPIMSLAWPLAALGLTMVAASIVFPLVQARVGAEIPVGAGRVTLGGSAGRNR